MWRINREAVLLGAGPTALLLQLAHPLVAEGVAAHSDFEADPSGRLRRTLRTTLAMVFGDGPAAEAAVRRLNRVHAAVRGEAADPEARVRRADAYRALDPALLLWVQATLIWTSVAGVRAMGRAADGGRSGGASGRRHALVGARLGIPLDAQSSRLAGLRGVLGAHAWPRRARSASRPPGAGWGAWSCARRCRSCPARWPPS